MQLLEFFRKARTPRAWTPYLILIYALLISFFSSYYIADTTHKNNQLRFINQVTLFEDNIEGTFSTYTALLLGGRSLFSTSNEIKKNDFKQYVDNLELGTNYQGMTEIGYIKRDTITNTYPLTYLEPETPETISQLGFNMFSDPERAQAMQRARDTGRPIATRLVTFTTTTGATEHGFIIFVPLYATQTVPQTVEQRRAELVGFIYSPFYMHQFITGIFGTVDPTYVDFSILTNSLSNEQSLLFQTPQDSSRRAYRIQREMTIGGTSWFIEYRSTPEFEANFERYIGEFIFVIGTSISLALFFLSRSQYDARTAIERSAIRVLQSEQTVQKVNKKISGILESINDGFFTINEKMQCTFINNEGARLLSLSTEEALGKSIEELFPEKEYLVLSAFIKKVLSDGIKTIELFREETSNWYLVKAYPSEEGVTILMQDITKRKKLEKQKDEFIGIASHELKTPVTSIKAYTQVLYKRFIKQGNTQAAFLLQKMDGQIDRLTALITDLLDSTKIESGKLQLTKVSYPIDDLIKETVEEMQRTTDQHTIVVEGMTHTSIVMDKDRIAQVLINLISNAIKYSPQTNTIQLTVQSNVDHVTICVKDYGLGIPKNLQKEIFKRFFRVEGSKELTFPGLGLGLYISAEIIRRHNGTLSVESVLNEGSTFCFTLPYSSEKTARKKKSLER